ncbi:MAG: UDP-N-acetylglucosamine 2-epimerase (non-hydrolyzing) [Chloroflexi bacterium]|nr:UDP-N-acetylglucosamine 2-epimerase (non-hydrolyzing) [Chloroflexota bacterium]
MKVLSILGARPEFIQAAPVSAALRHVHHEVLVHTGQHYDYLMSRVFLQELDIPEPDVNLEVGSGSQARQTGLLLERLEAVMERERPDWVIVRGDTNSTLAGALAAAKLRLPLAHIEAGARSFDRQMPEEVNRIVTDHLADVNFCIAPNGVSNLAAEGITEQVHHVGDVMCDALLAHLPVARRSSGIVQRLGLGQKRYVLATVHRAANTDDGDRLRRIVAALNSIAEPVVFPIHPRTRAALDREGLLFRARVLPIEPVGYRDMLTLESGARAIVTDSGGVTREAYLLGVPCITLRDETEHIETVTYGWNRLVGADPLRIVEAVEHFLPGGPRPPVFGDGHAAERIVDILGASVPRAARARARVVVH